MIDDTPADDLGGYRLDRRTLGCLTWLAGSFLLVPPCAIAADLLGYPLNVVPGLASGGALLLAVLVATGRLRPTRTFSVLAILAMTVAAAAFLAAATSRRADAAREQAAVQMIEARGGTCFSRRFGFYQLVVSVNLSDSAATDQDVEILLACSQLETLFLSHTKITGASCHTLSHFTRLRELHLSDNSFQKIPMSDDEALLLGSLTSLEQLRLPSSISRDAVGRLAERLPHCNIVAFNMPTR